MTFAPHFSTIFIRNLRPGVTARQVAKATGYKTRLVDVRGNVADIEVANDGRTIEREIEAIANCQNAGLL